MFSPYLLFCVLDNEQQNERVFRDNLSLFLVQNQIFRLEKFQFTSFTNEVTGAQRNSMLCLR